MLVSDNKKINHLINQYNLKQVITEPTHFTENSLSLVDLFFIRNEGIILHGEVIDLLYPIKYDIIVPSFSCLNSFVQNKSQVNGKSGIILELILLFIVNFYLNLVLSLVLKTTTTLTIK